MNEGNPKANRQGHTFRIVSGPFKGSTGSLQGITKEAGELAWPDKREGTWNNVVRLWFPWELIEEVGDGS